MVYADIKITNNTKMNHTMVSFSDHYNSIFIDGVPYKHKNWQFHGKFLYPKSYFFSLKV